MHTRKYYPKVGQLVKMKEWEDYRRFAPDAATWAWFQVQFVTPDSVTMTHSNAGTLLETVTVPQSVINPPIGWEPRYTIYCKPEQTDMVLGWFARGIVVRANHAIGDPAGSTFQPMDNASQPTWKHVQITDAIPAEDCSKVFRVVSVIQEEINSYSNPKHPNLRELGRSKRALAIKAMRADGWEVWYERFAYGAWMRRKETVIQDWN